MKENKKKINTDQVLQYAIDRLKVKHGISDVVHNDGVILNKSGLSLKTAIDSKSCDDEKSEAKALKESEEKKIINLFIKPQANFYQLIAIIEAKLSGKYKFSNNDHAMVEAAGYLIAFMKLEGEKNFDELLIEVESYVLANFATLDDSVIKAAPEVLFLPLPKSIDEYYEHFKVNIKAFGKKIAPEVRFSMLERFGDLLTHLIIHNFSNAEVNTAFLMRDEEYFFGKIMHKVLKILPSKLEKDFVTQESRSLLMQRLGDVLANFILYLIPEEDLHTILEICENAGLLDKMFAKVIDLFAKITVDELKNENYLECAKTVSKCLSEHGKRLELFKCLDSKGEEALDIMLALIKHNVLYAYQLSPFELSFIARKLDNVASEDDFKAKYYDTNPKFFTAFINHIEAFMETKDDNAYGNLVSAVATIHPELLSRLEEAKAKLAATGNKEGGMGASADCKAFSLLGLGFCAYSFYSSGRVSSKLVMGNLGMLSLACLSKEKSALLCATAALVVFGMESKILAASACGISLVMHSKDIYNYIAAKPQDSGIER